MATHDPNIHQAIAIFLDKRLNERGAFEWAASLDLNQQTERAAVRWILNHARNVVEPFASAWAWLLESWASNPELEPHSKHGLQLQVRRFGLHGHNLNRLIDSVRPWLKVEVREPWEVNLIYNGKKPRKKPRRPQELASFRISSGELIRLADVDIGPNTPVELLKEAFERVEASLIHGLRIAERIRDFRSPADSMFNDVHYVRAPANNNRRRGEDDDMYRKGFAPSVRLLDELLLAIQPHDVDYVRTRIGTWPETKWGIFRRLWASAASDRDLVTGDEVAAFADTLSDDEFWRVFSWREIAVLRAHRFNEMPQEAQQKMLRRIRRGPPKSVFSRRVAADEIPEAKRRASAIELSRLLAGGARLPDTYRQWYAATTRQLEEWEPLQSVDSDMTTFRIRSHPGFDPAIYDANSTTLLADLENALKEERASGNAGAFIRESLEVVVAKLEQTGAAAWYPLVISHLADHLSPVQQEPDAGPAAASVAREQLARRFLAVLNASSNDMLRASITSLASWMPDWAKRLRDEQTFTALWMRLWPYAVEVTNIQRPRDEEERNHRELASDALNTSVGRLFTALQRLMPSLQDNPAPFAADPLRAMRRMTMDTTGNARRQVLHRYLEFLEYARKADRAWVDENLLAPLLHSIGTDEEIWDAISRQPVLHYETMQIIGGKMAEKVRSSTVLPEETRARLAERLVFRILADRVMKVEPAVKDEVVQQMLRQSSDRIRAAGAWAVHYLLEAPELYEKKYTVKQKFDRAFKPFFTKVWPRELDLRSKQLSDVLAQLPAETKGHFADAVGVIERYLSPFDCWSLWEYRALGDEPSGEKIRLPNGGDSARALMTLLDKTIGDGEGAVRPHDLGKALEWMRQQVRNITADRRYARLEALSR